MQTFVRHQWSFSVVFLFSSYLAASPPTSSLQYIHYPSSAHVQHADTFVMNESWLYGMKVLCDLPSYCLMCLHVWAFLIIPHRCCSGTCVTLNESAQTLVVCEEIINSLVIHVEAKIILYLLQFYWTSASRYSHLLRQMLEQKCACLPHHRRNPERPLSKRPRIVNWRQLPMRNGKDSSGTLPEADFWLSCI